MKRLSCSCSKYLDNWIQTKYVPCNWWRITLCPYPSRKIATIKVPYYTLEYSIVLTSFGPKSKYSRQSRMPICWQPRMQHPATVNRSIATTRALNSYHLDKISIWYQQQQILSSSISMQIFIRMDVQQLFVYTTLMKRFW